jgi:hypothetical protein
MQLVALKGKGSRGKDSSYICTRECGGWRRGRLRRERCALRSWRGRRWWLQGGKGEDYRRQKMGGMLVKLRMRREAEVYKESCRLNYILKIDLIRHLSTFIFFNFSSNTSHNVTGWCAQGTATSTSGAWQRWCQTANEWKQEQSVQWAQVVWMGY